MIDYFDLLRKALEYLKAVGGICALCEHVEVVYINGSVKCKKLGDLVIPALRCVHYTGKMEFFEAIIKAEKKRGLNEPKVFFSLFQALLC